MRRVNNRQRLFEVMSRLDKTFKPKLNEEVDFVKPEEHQDEGAANKAKLEEIVGFAKKAYKYLPDGEIPAWVQDNITIARERISSVCGWMHAEEEQEETGEEGEHREMDDEEDHVTKSEKPEDEEEMDDEKKSEDDDDDEPEEEKEEEESEKKPKIPVVDIAEVGSKKKNE